jgi:hypothetical protein
MIWTFISLGLYWLAVLIVASTVFDWIKFRYYVHKGVPFQNPLTAMSYRYYWWTFSAHAIVLYLFLQTPAGFRFLALPAMLLTKNLVGIFHANRLHRLKHRRVMDRINALSESQKAGDEIIRIENDEWERLLFEITHHMLPHTKNPRKLSRGSLFFRWIVMFPVSGVLYYIGSVFFSNALLSIFPTSEFLTTLEQYPDPETTPFDNATYIAKTIAVFPSIVLSVYIVPRRRTLAAILLSVPLVLVGVVTTILYIWVGTSDTSEETRLMLSQFNGPAFEAVVGTVFAMLSCLFVWRISSARRS